MRGSYNTYVSPKLIMYCCVYFNVLCGSIDAAAAATVTYKLDGDLLVVQQVGSFKDDAKGTLADLLPHTVVDAHNIRGRRGHRWG